VDVHDAPEKNQFIPKGVPIVSRESIMKLARIFMTVRREIAEPRCETGARSLGDWRREEGRQSPTVQ